MQLNDNKMKIFSLEKKILIGVTLTKSAIRQINKLIEADPNMLGLRFSIKKSGCAGLVYFMEKVTQINSSDIVYEHDGARLYVPMKAMPFIDGTVLDYIQEGVNYVFKFNNPKAKSTCGCGKSFGI
ncbi:Protein SufA [secondary endosymbiont of Trabutina mannipara]|uniref:Protein SufA n=1 Tax=secondary endosymbiont of Trabutina mannipara TaxID=1835721 RepID=A0A1C3L404_9ENTR|nr:Fe-S cluster assembly scaffold SufA [secondary endosymbiont of Trabutina mannipara]SBT81994.1 Protein SufA [secondary endosymbiont of Trabutina mannipara]